LILSKSNLIIHEVTGIDKAIPVLNNVCIEEDGSTIAANGKVLIAVSPVNEKIKQNVPIEENKSGKSVVSSETIKEVLKNIPRDILFKGLLEYCDYSKGTFTSSDGKRKKKIEAKLYSRNYITYEQMFKKTCNKKSHKIVLNRKRLINLLQVIDKVCPDSTNESAVYIEFTDDNNIILKSVNHNNGQRCLALMTSYKNIEGKWLEADTWEKNLSKKKTAKKLPKN
jgi:hypothetical protein